MTEKEAMEALEIIMTYCGRQSSKSRDVQGFCTPDICIFKNTDGICPLYADSTHFLPHQISHWEAWCAAKKIVEFCHDCTFDTDDPQRSHCILRTYSGHCPFRPTKKLKALLLKIVDVNSSKNILKCIFRKTKHKGVRQDEVRQRKNRSTP